MSFEHTNRHQRRIDTVSNHLRRNPVASTLDPSEVCKELTRCLQACKTPAPALFTTIRGFDEAVSAALEMMSDVSVAVQKLQQAEPCAALLSLLESASLNPKLGISMSTGDVSLTISVPRMSARPSLRTLCLWFMLGICPEQQQIERLYQKQYQEQQDHKSSPQDEKSSELNSNSVLANGLLDLFREQTSLAVTSRKVSRHRPSLSLCIQSAAKGIQSAHNGQYFTDKMEKPFQYCPCYAKITGWDAENGVFSDDLRQSQQQQVVSLMINEFWKLVASKNYLPDLSLKEMVQEDNNAKTNTCC